MALDPEEWVAPLPNLPPAVAPAKPALDLGRGPRRPPPRPSPQEWIAPAKPALEVWSCRACVRSTRRFDFFTTSKPALGRGSDTSDEVRESLRDE